MLDPDDARVQRLIEWARGGGVVALTGAGLSTESGIPDYRSPEARPRRPIQGPEFARSEEVRRRYWARAFVGWERFRHARPNLGHHALAALEGRAIVDGVITQNVDRLHARAGARRVVELHGALEDVVCVGCGALEHRDVVQARLSEKNRHFIDDEASVAPDGDVDLAPELVARFELVGCSACGGALRPRVVFFGENVARSIVDEAMAMVDGARRLLVVGTSLAVFSGYRFLRRAAERDVSIAIVNRGPVRGEELAAMKIEASAGQVLRALDRGLGGAT